jgi:beta-lactamase superfamily II metal-dependent hydrolase
MPVVEGAIAYIDDCRGNFQTMAKVIGKEKSIKGRKQREAWDKAAMLWGDVVFVREFVGNKAHVSAKGHLLEIPKARLTDQSLLNIWQIDVGQGDASLIRFPDGKWAAIDLGPGRIGSINTNSGRTAVDFMAWMAFEDHVWMFRDGEGEELDRPFHFDWIAFSHPDEDHIGAGKQFADKLGRYWSVGTVYHNGMGRFSGEAREWTQASAGMSQLGEVVGTSEDELYLSTMIDGFADVDEYAATAPGRDWKLSGNWATIIKKLNAERGTYVGAMAKLSDRAGGNGLAAAPVSVKVLGPVEYDIPGSGGTGLRYLDHNKTTGFYHLGSPSLSRNGQSVVMRFDYGNVRILMTGDLNFKSHALLLQRWPADEFKCHVGKACHHGSEDISWKFLEAMSPIAIMFSSGDQESHVHPRALVLGMTGAFAPRLKWNRPQRDGTLKTETQSFAGHEEETLFSPLLYSTELSRSAAMGSGYKAYTKTKDEDGKPVHTKVANSWLAKADEGPFTRLSGTRIVEKLTYGLINVRTDGETVAIAVLEEKAKNPEFHVETFRPTELEPI